MSKPKMILCAIVGLVLLLAVAVVLFLYIADKAMVRTDTPVERRVADLMDGVAVARIVWPNARGFNLVLGYPTTQDLPPDAASGDLTITQDTNIIARVRLDPESAEKCNWLEPQHSLSAIILTWKMDSLFKDLQAGHTYTIRFNTDRSIDEASLWLTFLQSPADRRQAASSDKTDQR